MHDVDVWFNELVKSKEISAFGKYRAAEVYKHISPEEDVESCESATADDTTEDIIAPVEGG